MTKIKLYVFQEEPTPIGFCPFCAKAMAIAMILDCLGFDVRIVFSDVERWRDPLQRIQKKKIVPWFHYNDLAIISPTYPKLRYVIEYFKNLV